VVVVLLLSACPILVERNRILWTRYWNDLKPAMAAVRDQGLTHVALIDGGYFAGHVVAAGNPVDLDVRSLLPEEIEALPPDRRPRYLALLPTPGSPAPQFQPDGYSVLARGECGILYRR
jgi:hypothetical protein